MRTNLSAKIEVDWDTSNEGNRYSEEDRELIESLNVYARGTLERQVETIKVAKRLKRTYSTIRDLSICHSGNIPNRNCNGVEWDADASKSPYTTEELILMSKIAIHKRAPQGSVTDLAVQYGRTPWALTVRISKMRKTGEWKRWLDYERKQMARV